MIYPLEESNPSSFCYLSPAFRLPPPPPPPPLPPIPSAAPPCVVPVAAIPLPPLSALPPPVDCVRKLQLSQCTLRCEGKEENSPPLAEKASIPAVFEASATLFQLQPEELSAAETLVMLSEEARIVKNSYTPIFHRSPVAATAPSASPTDELESPPVTAPLLTTEQLRQIVLDLEKSARERDQKKQDDANRESNVSPMKCAESIVDEINMNESDEYVSSDEETNMDVDAADEYMKPVALTTAVNAAVGRPVCQIPPNQDKAFLDEFFVESPFDRGGMRVEEANSSVPQSMDTEEPTEYLTKEQFEQEFNKFAHTIDQAKEELLCRGANCERFSLPVTFFRSILASTAAAIAMQLWNQSKGGTGDNTPAPDLPSTAAPAAVESAQPLLQMSPPAAAQSIPDQMTRELTELQSKSDAEGAFAARQRKRHETQIRSVLSLPSRVSPTKQKNPAQSQPVSPIIDVDGSWEEEPSDDEKEHDKTVEYRLEEQTDAADAAAAALSDAAAAEEMMPLQDCGSNEFVSRAELLEHREEHAVNGGQAPPPEATPLEATPPETRSPSADVSSIFDLMSINCPAAPPTTRGEEVQAPPPHGALTPPSENDVVATGAKPNLQELEEMGALPCIVCYKMLWRSERNAHLVMEHGLRGVKEERLTEERKEADEGKKGRGYRCPRCPETFWLYDDVCKHVDYYHQHDYRPRCFTCGDEFRMMTDLVEHIRQEHTE
ncbi:hypothetical protein PRIPAC_86805 [Pristionchus pacificus]|uniref:C2H2-type domain-containing protein n=1 Tax=Pristionchus pacificus TaxID=54126 RepID=A0A2A6BKH3_PRIPA|nr:hypothetical protein PRIPAC_86805 [Pristionchus pacificus]|eukprot:PDM66412.1 hypothetical protein PRIPAC_47829 [Pristionchus pacificus]